MAVAVVDRVAQLLPDLYALRRVDAFPRHAVAIAVKAVGGDKGDYTEVDVATGSLRVIVDPEPPELACLVDSRARLMPHHPVLQHYLKSPSLGARLISDFVGVRTFHRMPLYGEFFSRLGVEDQLTVALLSRDAPVRAGVSVDRGARSFTDQDRAVLDALRPHLTTALANAQLFTAAASACPTDADGARIGRLSSRQLDVLHSVASGASNAQVALELGIREGTVRKHVEHILRRLEVSSRTAAAALYLRTTKRHD